MLISDLDYIETTKEHIVGGSSVYTYPNENSEFEKDINLDDLKLDIFVDVCEHPDYPGEYSATLIVTNGLSDDEIESLENSRRCQLNDLEQLPIIFDWGW